MAFFLRNTPHGRATPFVGLLLALVLATSAYGAEPPNQNDPCASGGRNTCDTTGVGFYERYRYGIRWFGDYTRAVPGVGRAFCIDLRFWYPGASYDYREFTAGPRLRNKDGRRVSLRNQRKMAYALWAHGRTNDRVRQAAVMLYVHSLMGDAAPGEVDPRGLDNPRIATVYDRISRQATRYHGPYRVRAVVPTRLRVGRRSVATVRVLSASGAAVPNLRVALSGLDGLPRVVRTGSNGIARVAFTPTSAGQARLRVAPQALPSNLPRLFRPTAGASARNGQRLAAAASQRRVASLTRTVAPAQVRATTAARPRVLLAGAVSRDRVTFTGAPASWRQRVTVQIFGPFRRRADIRCEGEPVWTSSFTGRPGVVNTPRARIAQPGIYTYRLIIPDSGDVRGETTACGEPAETFRVETQPDVVTRVSSDRIVPGEQLSDTLEVSGLNGEAVLVSVALHGPFATTDDITCDGAPAWTGTVAAVGDGTYTTDPVTLDTPGYYTYVESIAKTGFVRRQASECGEATETAVVVGQPDITTRVSKQLIRAGGTVNDSVVVRGIGALEIPVRVELHGPFEREEDISCVGTPVHTETFVATGSGTYTTKNIKLNAAGYYTYREFVDGSFATQAEATECGLASETTLVRAVPRVRTVVSRRAILPGGRIFDRVRVTGLAATTATVKLSLYGPFAHRDAIRCTGRPVWTGTIEANGNGTYRSPAVTLPRAGFYTYREEIARTPIIQPPKPVCAAVSETSLVRPLILTGRGDPASGTRAKLAAANAARPVRITSARLRINAPVSASAINVRKGILGVPDDVRRAGWWRDGAAPGDRSGSVLIAGHVDSARQGSGAFFRLRNANRRDRIAVRSANGRTTTYRVVSVRTYLKERLPAAIFTDRGPRRLVLVTCGGPFQPAEGAYRDNIVVTAVPVR